MTIHNLHSLFQPRRIAIVGHRDPVSAVVASNLASFGYAGESWLVNTGEPNCRLDASGTLEHIEELPGELDLVVACSPPAEIPEVIRECGDRGTRSVAILSHGFRESGPRGRAAEEAVRKQLQRFPQMRVLGPNCSGLLAAHSKLNATSTHGKPKPGRVAFISQSATLGSSALDWAIQEDIGFSYFVSVGNMIELGFSDLIDYFADDPMTDSIILYLESIDRARPFYVSGAGHRQEKKPIIVLKAGRYQESAQAAASHTGALAGIDAVYEAAFERAGVVRVDDIDDMFDCAQLLARRCHVRGPRLGIVTNAGGPGVVATDCLLRRQGKLASLSPNTIQRLAALLPSESGCHNPIDLLEDAGAERFAHATEAVLHDSGTDAVMVILTPQATTAPTAVAEAIAAIGQNARKPLLAVWMGGPAVREGIDLLHRAGIPAFATPKNAVHAFMHLVCHSQRREILYETPRMMQIEWPADKQQRERMRREIIGSTNEFLCEKKSKELLQLYGIAATQPELATSADDAVALAQRMGYPVALKIVSPQILHKNEVGGVILNLASNEQVRAAFDEVIENVRGRCPDATIEGASVQPMFFASSGIELMLGSRRDPAFGAVVMIGAGGAAAEVIDDTALGLPPLNERLAQRMLESLRCWPILAGDRSRPAVDVDQLLSALLRFSHFIAESPEIAEVDVNPIMATPTQIVALDACIRVEREGSQQQRPYGHLAIRPYPEELVHHTTIRDGTPLTLRPIRPEDEPAWHEMLTRCSPQSIRARFCRLFKEMTHEMATSFCFIDYDRELVIVAERYDGDRKRLVGCGHLVSNLNQTDAEYAVLVCDNLRGKGLGRILTEYCLTIAASWGLNEVVGETTHDNRPMIATFKKCGFDVDYRSSPDSVLVRYDLSHDTPARIKQRRATNDA